ncbi:MAG: response regulator [Rhodospirillaceae bacterium]|nr:response regulator [Rhodospirillaceae bacterium]
MTDESWTPFPGWQRKGAAQMGPSQPRENGRAVLIVEDEILISMAVQLALEELGFSRFVVATTETEAVDAARAYHPGLITADIRLHEGSGLRAVEAIWARGPVPTVFITATASLLPPRLRQTPVLQKPFTLERLQQTVRAVLALTPPAPEP